VRLPAGGRFDIPVLLDQPRLTHCFEATVAERLDDPGPARRRRLRFEPVTPIPPLTAGQARIFELQIVEGAGEPAARGIPDLEILALRPPGSWRQRPLIERLGGNSVRFTLTVPVAGSYRIVFSSPKLGLLGSLALTAIESDATASSFLKPAQ
jgi:hypothetical protein